MENSIAIGMELEQVRFLEFALPDEVFNSVYESDIAKEYHAMLRMKGCSGKDFGKAERTYRNFLNSILTDRNFWSAYIN